MNTVGPAISLRTLRWFLPQNEQWSEFFESLLATLLILPCRQSDRPGARMFYSTCTGTGVSIAAMRFFNAFCTFSMSGGRIARSKAADLQTRLASKQNYRLPSPLSI
jgi:hypothetical protein